MARAAMVTVVFQRSGVCRQAECGSSSTAVNVSGDGGVQPERSYHLVREVSFGRLVINDLVRYYIIAMGADRPSLLLSTCNFDHRACFS